MPTITSFWREKEKKNFSSTIKERFFRPSLYVIVRPAGLVVLIVWLNMALIKRSFRAVKHHHLTRRWVKSFKIDFLGLFFNNPKKVGAF